MQNATNQTDHAANPHQGWRRLVLCCITIGVIWLILLPALSRQPGMKAWNEQLDARGIDPSAMFYTELDAMDEILSEMETFQQTHPKALWIPTLAGESAGK